MKKILILGGTFFQIPVIKYAKSQGHTVITCDYLPNNPAHSLADLYVNVSTTDKDAVLSLAKEKKIDGILAYASDPAAPTAAFVAEELRIPGNSYKSVEILSEKHLFRSFLKKNRFNYPKFELATNQYEFNKVIANFNYPFVVKPVDSSGNKGITIVRSKANSRDVFNKALQYSRLGKVIIEDFIHGPQIHGDGFVLNGELLFAHLGDHMFNEHTDNSTMYPSNLDDTVIIKAKAEVNKVIKKLGFSNGGVNIEIRVDEKTGEPHIIEIGARNGGHFTPDIITHATDFDFARSAVDAALGIPYKQQKIKNNGYFLNLILYAKKNGIFKSLNLDTKLKDSLVSSCVYKKRGDTLIAGRTSNTSVAVLQLSFNTREQMETIYNDSEDLYEIEMED